MIQENVFTQKAIKKKILSMNLLLALLCVREETLEEFPKLGVCILFLFFFVSTWCNSIPRPFMFLILFG